LEVPVAVHICFHDRCFDGAASAALFGRFYRDAVDRSAEARYFGLTHRTGGGMDRSLLEADQSAIVDFGFENTPALSWWFDHHQSAFRSEEDRASFSADASGKKFFDPAAPSCTGFMARVLKERFGYEAASFAETVRWADIIDAARFPDAETAVALEAPALKLMTVIEGERDPAFLRRLIPDLAERTLDEIVSSDYVRAPLEPILARHRANVDRVKARAICEGGVVAFDLIGSGADSFNKFIAYWLFPEARYSVGLTLEPTRAKISVGSNPWARVPRSHNLAEICARYGGGGHAVVGAVSLPKDDVERARKAFGEIVATLKVG
jgi:hypothetical protein